MSVLVAGLTGQSGAGKTTVGRVLTEKGFYHIDCDRLAHSLLLPGTKCSEGIKANFPMFFTSGEFDRKKAAGLLFSDRELLDRYNGVIFPYITEEIMQRIAGAESSGEKIVLLDAPTLFEAGADRLCDVIIACVANEEIRLERIMERDGISELAARKRFSSQHTEDFFRTHADIVLVNNGTVAEITSQAEIAAEEIRKKK